MSEWAEKVFVPTPSKPTLSKRSVNGAPGRLTLFNRPSTKCCGMIITQGLITSRTGNFSLRRERERVRVRVRNPSP
jgi:hypothetical protein